MAVEVSMPTLKLGASSWDQGQTDLVFPRNAYGRKKKAENPGQMIMREGIAEDTSLPTIARALNIILNCASTLHQLPTLLTPRTATCTVKNTRSSPL